jgi:hypothetical protein
LESLAAINPFAARVLAPFPKQKGLIERRFIPQLLVRQRGDFRWLVRRARANMARFPGGRPVFFDTGICCAGFPQGIPGCLLATDFQAPTQQVALVHFLWSHQQGAHLFRCEEETLDSVQVQEINGNELCHPWTWIVAGVQRSLGFLVAIEGQDRVPGVTAPLQQPQNLVEVEVLIGETADEIVHV